MVADLLVPMLSAMDDEVAFAAAESLTTDRRDRITALHVCMLPEDLIAPDGNYHTDPLDITAVNGRIRKRERRAIGQRLKQSGATTRLLALDLEIRECLRRVAKQSRLADLTVLRRPPPAGSPDVRRGRCQVKQPRREILALGRSQSVGNSMRSDSRLD